MIQGWGLLSVPNLDRAYVILKARGMQFPEPVATNETFQIRTCHLPYSERNRLEICKDVPAGH